MWLRGVGWPQERMAMTPSEEQSEPCGAGQPCSAYPCPGRLAPRLLWGSCLCPLCRGAVEGAVRGGQLLCPLPVWASDPRVTLELQLLLPPSSLPPARPVRPVGAAPGAAACPPGPQPHRETGACGRAGLSELKRPLWPRYISRHIVPASRAGFRGKGRLCGGGSGRRGWPCSCSGPRAAGLQGRPGPCALDVPFMGRTLVSSPG